MVVLLYAVEAEVLTSLEAPGRGKFLAETAGAYRARGKCLAQLGRDSAAAADRKRADDLDAEARKVLAAEPKAKPAAEVQVLNNWTEPVTLVVDGVSYRIEVGATRAVPLSGTSVSYEMLAGPHRTTGTLEAGKTYTIRPPTP
jgi:hypothetical protein